MARNNLGNSYDNLKLSGLAVEEYKKSEELNETLASANLAHKFIKEGFYKQAKEVLEKAKGQQSIHENVWFYLQELAKKETEEDEKETELLLNGESFRNFLLKFAKKYLLKNLNEPLFFNGSWNYKNQMIQIKALPNPIYYELSLKIDSYNYSFSLPLGNANAVIGSGSVTTSWSGTSNKLNAFAYFDDQGKVLNIFSYDSKDHKGKIIELKKM